MHNIISKGKQLAWLLRHDKDAREKGFIDEYGYRKISEIIHIQEKSVIEFDITLQENQFTGYSAGGFYLFEDENEGENDDNKE